MQESLRRLPSVDALISQPPLQTLLQDYPHELLVSLARSRLDEARRSIQAGTVAPSLESLTKEVRARAMALGRPSLRPVINAAGVILHTNLGRAPLSAAALKAAVEAARGYSNLEFDLASGERGSRQHHVENLLCQLTGAEAALVVNNNAAAVLLGLIALARGKEVIVSRGQAVEIGGGFRIPDVMRQSGARLVEVGTTNRTRLADYAQAITPKTAALMRVHPSNFRVVGFTESVPLEEMAALAGARGILLLDDLGSGCLLDTERFGLAHEPTPQESLAAGADLAFFSGDKLLGGPQAGVAVGKGALVAKLRAHPLARAVRIDKMSLAALVATLLHYLRGEALETVPVWRMIATPRSEVERRAMAWAEAIPGRARVVAGETAVGGGSLPGATLPTMLLAITAAGGGRLVDLAARLRSGEPPVVARIERNRLLLDPRTVLPEEDESLIGALRRALGVEGP